MPYRFKLAASLVLAGALMTHLGAAPAAEPLKVAFVYVGPVGDAGWTYAHDQGRLAMEKALGDKVKTTFVESVPEGADAERVIRKLAVDGNRLIFATSFGYMNAMDKIARVFPNVVFEHATGYKRAKNLGTYETRLYEAAYLDGIIAGKMTKSNTLGVVASFPVPEVVRNVDAFTLGAQSVNPAVRTKVVWVNTWYDPAKERQAAEALIAQGADILSQCTDSPATLQTAQEKGIYAFGWDSDMTRFAPKAHLTAGTNVWGEFYAQTAQAVIDGTWKSSDIHGGLREGMVKMAPLNPVIPAPVVKIFEERKAAIAQGRFHPFQGPIKDQAGAIRVATGADMPQDQVQSLNFFVQGVDGTLQK